MLKRLKGAAVGCVALALLSTAVWAAGNYSTYPIVGGASFCVSTVGVNGQQGNTGQGGGTAGTAGAYCAQTVPAGPSALTGSELIPMDTGLAGGAPPQSVVMSSTWLHAGYFQVVTTGTSVTVGAGIQNLILNTGGTVMAVTLPAAPYDNQVVKISNVNTVLNGFSVTANTGQSLVQQVAPTNLSALTANTSAAAGTSSTSYLYRASNTSWYRVD